MLERVQEGVVDELGFVVALGFLEGLLFEAEALVEGVVELRIGVNDLLESYKGFKSGEIGVLVDDRARKRKGEEGGSPFAEADVGAMVFGERAHHLWVARDERRIDTFLFDEFADKLVDYASVGLRWGAFDFHFLEDALEEFVSFFGVELVAGRELFAGRLFERRNHLDSLPWLGPVDLECLPSLGVESRVISTCDVMDEARDKVLGHIHDIVYV